MENEIVADKWFYPLEEAAKLLRITEEELVEIGERLQIYVRKRRNRRTLYVPIWEMAKVVKKLGYRIDPAIWELEKSNARPRVSDVWRG